MLVMQCLLVCQTVLTQVSDEHCAGLAHTCALTVLTCSPPVPSALVKTALIVLTHTLGKDTGEQVTEQIAGYLTGLPSASLRACLQHHLLGSEEEVTARDVLVLREATEVLFACTPVLGSLPQVAGDALAAAAAALCCRVLFTVRHLPVLLMPMPCADAVLRAPRGQGSLWTPSGRRSPALRSLRARLSSWSRWLPSYNT